MKMTAGAVIGVAMLALGGSRAHGGEPKWLSASHDKLPLWRGFNLTDKFHKEWSNGPFQENDFRWISEFGFNFVRLPMDYRCWIKDGDWTQFDEDVLKEIDDAVRWGEQYGIHVSINFHRAPGYTVASPKEKTSVWTDPETQRVCALHWALFAKRYRGIPNKRLSFNLFNEPAGIDGKTYYHVAKILVEAIRKEDPNRLIIADGEQWCKRPCKELYPLKIAQATRGYSPFWLTHYKASWVKGTDTLPVPVWPRPKVSGWLTAGGKKKLSAPLRLCGPFAVKTALRLRVHSVSDKAMLVVAADGKTIFEKRFSPGEGKGEWKESEYKKRWNIHQAIYNVDCAVEIPAGTREVTTTMTDGDWMTISELGLRPEGREPERVLSLMCSYGSRGGPVTFTRDGQFESETTEDRDLLWAESIVPWLKAEKEGTGVMVGEFGAHNRTPHDVTLRWMEDCLLNWRKAGWGWALWNFRGSFGILDSQRKDVKYEDFHGHKLDRKMLELLQRYR
ncbi:MAG: cellulase family glycosylhydrolase [Lentisphaeria bacterium]|nr:cellulase family glycosylhydrolase [Lentisphaeria bacterium]